MFTTKRLILVASAMAILAAPAQATPVGGWSAPVWLSDGGQHAWTPEAAYGENGTGVLAWGRYTGSDYVLQAVTRSAAGTLGQVQDVGDSSTMPIDEPAVAVDRLGNALIAWNRFNGFESQVEAVTLSAAGELGEVETLSRAGQSASEPQLAVNASGDGVVAWTRYDGSHTLLEARTMSTSGDVGGLEIISDDEQDARNADVGIDGEGDAFLVWERTDSQEVLILARTLLADGSLHVERTLSNPGFSASWPEVAVNARGDAAFTWTRSDGSYYRVQGVVDLASAPIGNIHWFSAGGQSAEDATTAIDSTGDGTFAWTRWDGDTWRIQSIRLPASDVPGVRTTHSDDGGNASDPSLAMDPDGNAAIAWDRWDGAISRTQVVRLSTTGAAGAVSTRSAAGEDTDQAQLAIGPDARLLLTWEAFDGAYWRIKYSHGVPVKVIDTR
jgi:hypothetical protein